MSMGLRIVSKRRVVPNRGKNEQFVHRTRQFLESLLIVNDSLTDLRLFRTVFYKDPPGKQKRSVNCKHLHSGGLYRANKI